MGFIVAYTNLAWSCIAPCLLVIFPGLGGILPLLGDIVPHLGGFSHG